MPKLETRVIVTDSEGDECTCTEQDLQKLLLICTSMVQFHETTFKAFDLWIEGNHLVGVELEVGSFYIGFEDAQAYVDLIESHLSRRERSYPAV